MATSKKSTGKKSKNQTSSQAATPANRSARQANAKAHKTRDTFGHGYEQPLANYDPTTQSWKMCQVTSLWEEPKSLERLPKSGMTRNGVLYQQPDWVPIISEKESSSWPTPTASDHIERKSTQQTPNSRHSLNLPDAVRRWPTPTAAGDVSNAKGKFANPTLGDAVRMWPTPRASKGMADKMETSLARVQKEKYRSRLEESVAMNGSPTGKLNPTWVEWLMGFPTGWTNLED